MLPAVFSYYDWSKFFFCFYIRVMEVEVSVFVGGGGGEWMYVEVCFSRNVAVFFCLLLESIELLHLFWRCLVFVLRFCRFFLTFV